MVGMMAALEELVRLLGSPPLRKASPEDWTEVEGYIGASLPHDFKGFLDLYGSGVVSGGLVVFHPHGSSPLLDRMHQVHQAFGEWSRRRPDSIPFVFHPEQAGLISWGYDHDGDEYFFWPCDPDPARWKIVTVFEGHAEVFDGQFTGFVLAFVDRLRTLDPCHGLDSAALEFLEPEDLAELREQGEIGPVEPSFESF